MLSGSEDLYTVERHIAITSRLAEQLSALLYRGQGQTQIKISFLELIHSLFNLLGCRVLSCGRKLSRHLIQFRRMVFIMLQHIIQDSGHLILCFRNFMAVIMAMVPAVRRASLAAGMCLGLMAVGMFLFMAVLMAVGMRMLIRMSMRMLMFMTMTD